jgi:hypothetical protein
MDFRAVFLPYCLTLQPDGRYAVVNRRYKPLGFNTLDWVNYADQPILATIKGLSPAMAARLSWEGSEDLKQIYLYNDGRVPTQSAEAMDEYTNRLALLAKLPVE